MRLVLMLHGSLRLVRLAVSQLVLFFLLRVTACSLGY